MKIVRKIKYITSVLFPLFYFLIFPSPAYALSEGDCLSSLPLVVTGSVTDSSGIDPASLMVTIDGITPKFFSYDGLTGAWSATFKDESEVSDGDHTLLVEATDECGSGNYSSTTINFKVDTEATVTITFPADGSTILSNMCTVSGTADPDISTMTVDGTTGITVTDGEWTYTLSPCPIDSCDAPLTISVSAMDACGNPANDSSTVWVTCSGVCAYQVPGAPILVQSLPREDPATHLAPDSVTLNMSTNAYLKFVYNESMKIDGASVNIGTLSLEETNYGDDTVVWSATLDYETDYTLNITGLVDCDEGNAVTIPTFTLRTARDVVYPATAADRRAQTGGGFIDGSLTIRVIDDFDGTEVQNAVVQINTSVTWDNPGWMREIKETSTGSVTFESATVALNQPITITAMAPGYQYLTFYELDAREVILGLRPSGYKYSQRQQTNIIGDFDPAQYDSVVHPMIEREGSIGNYRPTRLGLASLGLHKRSINALGIEDVLANNVVQRAIVGGWEGNISLNANLLAPDYIYERFDIPSAVPSFEVTTFFRLNTTRTGDMYVSVVVGSCNNWDPPGPYPLPYPYQFTASLFTKFLLTMSSFDVQRITVPQGPGTCMIVVLDTTDRGVTSDPLNGCTIIADPVAVGARRTNIGKYPYGWGGQGQTDESTWYEPGFSFARAVRINMSNWPYDPDFDENYSARIRTTDYLGNPIPAVIPTLQGGLIEMDDNILLPFHFMMLNLIDPANNVASKLAGYPDLVAIESDLSLPAGSLTLVIVSTAFDREIRFVGSVSRGDALTVESPTVLLTEVSEWIPWARGYKPIDPGFNALHEPIVPTTTGNSLVDRLFEAWELTAAGPSTLSVIGDGADYDPVGHPGVDVDPEFNSEVLMMRLVDSVSTTSYALEPSYRWIIGYGEDPNPDTPVYGPISNPVWRFYAPPKLVQGGRVKIHLPKVPTVSEIDTLLPGQGQAYTFESPTQSGIPNDFQMAWELSAHNYPTHANLNNFVPRDMLRFDVWDLSQNRQFFFFQKE